MKFLVTGGAGFIGSHVCERLLHSGHAVWAFDDLNAFYDPRLKQHNLRDLQALAKPFEFVHGDLSGSVAANQVRFRSSQKIEGTRLFYDFSGTVDGDKMSGSVSLGEYGEARWTAQRHRYQTPGGVIRPVKTV